MQVEILQIPLLRIKFGHNAVPQPCSISENINNWCLNQYYYFRMIFEMKILLKVLNIFSFIQPKNPGCSILGGKCPPTSTGDKAPLTSTYLSLATLASSVAITITSKVLWVYFAHKGTTTMLWSIMVGKPLKRWRFLRKKIFPSQGEN